MHRHSRKLAGLSAFTATLALGLLFIAGCPQNNDNSNSNDNTNTNTNTNDNANDNSSTTGNSGLTGKFVGSARCAECHNNIHSDWSQTLHGNALATLEAIGQGSNPDCVICHTVGYGQEGGWVDRATTNDLANVGCEACHGAARDHTSNVSDENLRPPKDISAEICGQCHTGERHPNYDEWLQSGHALVTETPAEEFEAGTALNTCGRCHSGDFFYKAVLQSETVADDALMGVAREDQHAVECAICHNPHSRTGNAVNTDAGRDYQLRFPEVASPTPTNTIDATTDPARFNLCGQCHHDRGRTWETTSRQTHPSNQSNVYVGEMPLPDDNSTPLVLSRVSVHSFASQQCATCHMYRQDFQSAEAPAIAGHTFQVNNTACANVGCHPSTAAAIAAQATLQAEIQTRLDGILARLGDPATWEYSANGGPSNQSTVSDGRKQIRFLYYYALSDGSLGVHNPAYVRDMMDKAEELLTTEGL